MVGGCEVEHHNRSPELRWYRRDEIVELLVATSFAVAVLGGFEGHPLRRSDSVLVVTATRPTE